MNLVIIAEICPYCRKGRSPREIMRFSSFTICHSCYERHNAALQALTTGKYAGECSECGQSIDEIKARQGDGDTGVRMAVHFENGIYRPMCMECDRIYVPKRADLYRDTEYWKTKGL